MDKLLRDALTTLGCDDKHIRLFLACYQQGTAPLSELTKLARLQRSTAYVIMQQLVDRGLVQEDHKAYGKAFTAAAPETLLRLVANRQRQIGRQHLALQEHLGELQSLYQANHVQPRVRTYQGVNGLLSVWRDILTAQGEILLWTNQTAESKLFNTAQHDQFIAERQRRGCFVRVLAVDNSAGRQLRAEDGGALRETRLLPAGIDFSAETYLYDHKMAVLDYQEDIIGIITESAAVAAAQTAMFEAAWRQRG